MSTSLQIHLRVLVFKVRPFWVKMVMVSEQSNGLCKFELLLISTTEECTKCLVQAGRDMKFLGFSMATCFVGGSIMLLVGVLNFSS